MSEKKQRPGQENLIPFDQLPEDEQRKIRQKGGRASAKARKAKADMRKLMKMMLETKAENSDMTYAQKLTLSMLTIASSPDKGGAAVKAYETILHITGQDEPEADQESVKTLKVILEENRKNARLSAEQETE